MLFHVGILFINAALGVSSWLKNLHPPNIVGPAFANPGQTIATYYNIVGRNTLHAFGHHVATCCEMKFEVDRTLRRNIVTRTWQNDFNIMQHPLMLHEKFDHFQIWANNTQHVATRRNRVAKRKQHIAPNNVAICRVGIVLLIRKNWLVLKWHFSRWVWLGC